MPSLTGAKLGSYHILEIIGHGGMSVVYKAYHIGTDRLVAIKILPDVLAQDPLLVERFHREARVVARLEHRHIVPIYDFGEFGGVVYLAMRYLQAGTVKDVLTRSKLSLADAMPIITQVASALDYAHEQGVVHRDVKPGNILVDQRGDAYLTDFGLAKLVEASGQLTNTGSLVGTPAYMAPEQTLGQPVSPATDVYALGVMVYEIATGRLPFVSDTPMALALMHLQATLPLPRTVNPALPEAVEQVILKVLDKEPSQRYPTAGEFVSALAAASEAEKPAAPTEPAELARIAGEIAGQKAPEEVSSGLRTEIHRQASAEQRRRLMRWVPWAAAGLAMAGLLVGLLFFSNQAAQARLSGEQTATAIMVLFNELDRAQTAVAAGGTAELPTVQHLQTQVAAALTAGATVRRVAANTAAATASGTASETATDSPTPPPTQPAATLTLPPPTAAPRLEQTTAVPTAFQVVTNPPADTPTDTTGPPTDTPAPPTDTSAPPSDTPMPSDTPTPPVITDTPTDTTAPPTDTPTLSGPTVTPSVVPSDTPTPEVTTPVLSQPADTPTDTPVGVTPAAQANPATSLPPTDTLVPQGDTPAAPANPATDTPPPPADTVAAPAF